MNTAQKKSAFDVLVELAEQGDEIAYACVKMANLSDFPASEAVSVALEQYAKVNHELRSELCKLLERHSLPQRIIVAK